MAIEKIPLIPIIEQIPILVRRIHEAETNVCVFMKAWFPSDEDARNAIAGQYQDEKRFSISGSEKNPYGVTIALHTTEDQQAFAQIIDLNAKSPANTFFHTIEPAEANIRLVTISAKEERKGGRAVQIRQRQVGEAWIVQSVEFISKW